jgi:hypothetical protein
MQHQQNDRPAVRRAARQLALVAVAALIGLVVAAARPQVAAADEDDDSLKWKCGGTNQCVAGTRKSMRR